MTVALPFPVYFTFMQQEWSIQSRGDRCAATGEPFLDGQYFYTLLYREDAGFRREDLSEPAYAARDSSAAQPFSLWRSKFEKPAEKPPEAIERASAEEMLRWYMERDGKGFANVRYILAVMLERKRQLKEVETRRTESGLVRVYTHGKSGEIFVIPDPELRLEQLAEVQMEVMDLLTAGRPSEAAAPVSNESEAAQLNVAVEGDNSDEPDTSSDQACQDEVYLGSGERVGGTPSVEISEPLGGEETSAG